MRCRPAAAFSMWVMLRDESLLLSRATDLWAHTPHRNYFYNNLRCYVCFLLTHLQCTALARLDWQLPRASCLSREFASAHSKMVFPPLWLSDICSNTDAYMCLCAYVDVYGFVCLRVSLQCLGLLPSPPLPLQAHVKAAELLQESWVGTNISVRPDSSHSFLEPQVLNNHQEG